MTAESVTGFSAILAASSLAASSVPAGAKESACNFAHQLTNRLFFRHHCRLPRHDRATHRRRCPEESFELSVGQRPAETSGEPPRGRRVVLRLPRPWLRPWPPEPNSSLEQTQALAFLAHDQDDRLCRLRDGARCP